MTGPCCAFTRFSYFRATNLSTTSSLVSHQALEALQVLLPRHGVCIAVKEKLKKDSGVAGKEAYDAVVTSLLSKPRARGE